MSSSKRSALSEPMVATRQFAPAPASIQGCSSRRSISCGSSSLAALSMRRRRVESTATVSSYTSVWVAAISKLDTSSEAVSGPRSGKRGSTRSGSGSQRSTRESAQPWLCSWMGFVIPVSSTLLRESRTVGVGTGFFSSVTPRTLQVPSVHRGNPLAVEDAVVAHSLRRETHWHGRNSRTQNPPRIRGSTTCARRTGYFAPAARRDQSRVLARVRSLCPSTPRSWDDEGGQGDCPSFEVGAEHDRNVRTRSTFGFGRPISLH